MKKWPYVLNNSKDDACEEPKLVYNIENHTLVPKVGNETSDEDVWNASLMRMKVMKTWVTRNMFFSLASTFKKKMLFVLITVLGMMYDS